MHLRPTQRMYYVDTQVSTGTTAARAPRRLRRAADQTVHRRRARARPARADPRGRRLRQLHQPVWKPTRAVYSRGVRGFPRRHQLTARLPREAAAKRGHRGAPPVEPASVEIQVSRPRRLEANRAPFDDISSTRVPRGD